MPEVILIRLVPMKPTTGADFSNYLSNLSIRAFDLSFGNTADGTLVGQAQGAGFLQTVMPLDVVAKYAGPITNAIRLDMDEWEIQLYHNLCEQALHMTVRFP